VCGAAAQRHAARRRSGLDAHPQRLQQRVRRVLPHRLALSAGTIMMSTNGTRNKNRKVVRIRASCSKGADRRKQRVENNAALDEEKRQEQKSRQERAKAITKHKLKRRIAQGLDRAILLPPFTNAIQLELDVAQDVLTDEEDGAASCAVTAVLASKNDAVASGCVHKLDGSSMPTSDAVYLLSQYLRSRTDEFGLASNGELKHAIGIDMLHDANGAFCERLRDNALFRVCDERGEQKRCDFGISSRDPMGIYDHKGLCHLFEVRLPRGDEFVDEATQPRHYISAAELQKSYRQIMKDVDELVAEGRVMQFTPKRGPNSGVPLFYRAVRPPPSCSTPLYSVYRAVSEPENVQELKDMLRKDCAAGDDAAARGAWAAPRCRPQASRSDARRTAGAKLRRVGTRLRVPLPVGDIRSLVAATERD